MKIAQPHIVSFSKQAIEFIKGLRPLTDNKQYVFYNPSIAKPMDSNALLCVIQLAHGVGNSVSQAYNHAQNLEYRTKMMQGWSDFIDGINLF